MTAGREGDRERGRCGAGWRRVVAAGLAAGALGAWGCGGQKADRRGSQSGEFVILTSFYPIYVQALNLAAGVPGVVVRNLTAPTTGCLHDYQLSPQELAAVARADVLLVNGAGMEAFLERIIRQHADLPVVEASAGIELICADGHDHATHAEGGHEHAEHAEGEVNPHVWVSPAHAITQVRNLAAGLARADPPRAAQYLANAESYVARLEDLRRRLREALAPLSQRRVVTMHEAFPYFAREFGLEIAAVVEREPGTEPSSGELAEIIELVRRTGIRVIFAEPQYPLKTAEVIARETGARVCILDPAVTGPDRADAYLTIMDQNLATLRDALQ